MIPPGMLDMRQRREDDQSPPKDVQAAIRFVRICNDFIEIKPVVIQTDMDASCEVYEQELPVCQDAVFRLACRRLAAYFSEHTPKETKRVKGKAAEGPEAS